MDEHNLHCDSSPRTLILPVRMRRVPTPRMKKVWPHLARTLRLHRGQKACPNLDHDPASGWHDRMPNFDQIRVRGFQDPFRYLDFFWLAREASSRELRKEIATIFGCLRGTGWLRIGQPVVIVWGMTLGNIWATH